MTLPIIPHTEASQNLDKKREIRSKLRSRQLQNARREPDQFEVNDEVVVRSDKTGRWNIHCVILSKRNRGGMVRYYTLLSKSSGKIITRNERHIRMLSRITTDEAGRVLIESKPLHSTDSQVSQDGGHCQLSDSGAPARRSSSTHQSDHVTNRRPEGSGPRTFSQGAGRTSV